MSKNILLIGMVLLACTLLVWYEPEIRELSLDPVMNPLLNPTMIPVCVEKQRCPLAALGYYGPFCSKLETFEGKIISLPKPAACGGGSTEVVSSNTITQTSSATHTTSRQLTSSFLSSTTLSTPSQVSTSSVTSTSTSSVATATSSSQGVFEIPSWLLTAIPRWLLIAIPLVLVVVYFLYRRR